MGRGRKRDVHIQDIGEEALRASREREGKTKVLTEGEAVAVTQFAQERAPPWEDG